MSRCEAQHRTHQWPYVRRCKNPIAWLTVRINYRQGREDLYEIMDLCNEDYMEYINTLTLQEAKEVAAKAHFIGQGPRPD